MSLRRHRAPTPLTGHVAAAALAVAVTVVLVVVPGPLTLWRYAAVTVAAPLAGIYLALCAAGYCRRADVYTQTGLTRDQVTAVLAKWLAQHHPPHPRAQTGAAHQPCS